MSKNKKQYLATAAIPLIIDTKGIVTVVFQLKEHKYALSLENVVEIIRIVAITSLPEIENDFIEGIINFRGEIIPVVNLNKQLNGQREPYTLNTHIIVAQKEKYKLGLIVDCVNRVMQIPCDIIKPAFEIAPQSKYLRGIAKTEIGLLLILDVNFLFQQSVEIYHDKIKADIGE